MLLNWVDYLILGVIALSALLGHRAGGLRTILSLLTWLLAFVIAFYFRHMLQPLLSHWINDPQLQGMAGFLLLFIAVLLTGSLVIYLLLSAQPESPLSLPDMLAGAGIGLLRGGYVVAVIVFVLGSMPLARAAWWHTSLLLPGFQRVFAALVDQLP